MFEALPEVLVPDWPEDPTLYASALLSLRCFDAPSVSREDLERTQMYASEKQREGLRAEVSSLDDWLRTLGIVVRAERLKAGNRTRAAQLLNKTNQMNLGTRRLSEQELEEWALLPGHELYVLHVSDRFGDAGLTGIVSFCLEGDKAHVVDFVLSCRVMGRKIEETMAHLVVDRARSKGARAIEARYLATPKNVPCLEFWQRSGFEQQEEVFSWREPSRYPLPPMVSLHVDAS